jgi:hypothetical protein
VACALWRVPAAAKVHVLNGEVSGYQEITGSGGQPEDGAIVTNAVDKGPAGISGSSPDAFDEFSFREGQAASTIAKNTTCCVLAR